MSSPEVRALHLKTLVRTLPALGEDHAAAAEAAIPSWTRRRIAAAANLEWLPCEFLVDVCEAAHAQVGDAALQAWGTAALDAVLKTPLARAFYEAALRIGGREPGIILSYVARAWPLLYREVGELVVTHRAPGVVRLLHAPVPPLVRRPATLLPLLGALVAVCSHCGCEGDGEAEWTPESPRFVYTIRWLPPAGP
jgi:hypothetical protein